MKLNANNIKEANTDLEEAHIVAQELSMHPPFKAFVVDDHGFFAAIEEYELTGDDEIIATYTQGNFDENIFV